MGRGKKGKHEEEEYDDDGEEEGEEEYDEEDAEEEDDEDDEDYDYYGEEDAGSSDEFEDVKPEYQDKEQESLPSASGFIKSDQNEQILKLEQILPPHLIQKKSDQIRSQVGNSKYSDHEFNQKTNKGKVKA